VLEMKESLSLSLSAGEKIGEGRGRRSGQA